MPRASAARVAHRHRPPGIVAARGGKRMMSVVGKAAAWDGLAFRSPLPIKRQRIKKTLRLDAGAFSAIALTLCRSLAALAKV
jgi:hypothetical protein